MNKIYESGYRTTWTIVGYCVGQFGFERYVTYYGTLSEAIRYADNEGYKFTHYGDETVEIREGDTVYARQEWEHGYDEAGEYYAPKEWQQLVFLY